MIVDRNWYATLDTARRKFILYLETIVLPQVNAIFGGTLKHFLHQLTTDPELLQKDTMGIHFPFKNKKGEIVAVYAVFCPSFLANGFPAYLFGWGHIQITATKSDDYMIVTHSKSGFLSSKTWTELVKLPAGNKGITHDESAGLLGILAPLVNLRFQDIAQITALSRPLPTPPS
jgi:hypothetical protein